MDLREGPAHHHVVRRGNELEPGLVVVAPDVFGVGGVEHQQHGFGQRAAQSLDFVERQIGAGRIVGVGDEDDLRARAHRGEDRVDVRRVVLFAGYDRRPAGRQRRNRIDQEAVGGVDRLLARPEKGLRQEMQQFVRPRPADDARRVEAERAADRLAQFGGGPVRIILKMMADSIIGRDRMRAWSERRLVGGEFEHFGSVRRGALARHIGLDREHAGTRFGTLSCGHRKLRSRPFGRAKRPRVFWCRWRRESSSTGQRPLATNPDAATV